MNQVDGKIHSQVLVHNVIVRKLTYEDKDAKGDIVNIYQKLQASSNYPIDICSNEGDWVLDLLLGSGKFYYIKLNLNILVFSFYIFILIFLIISFVLDD